MAILILITYKLQRLWSLNNMNYVIWSAKLENMSKAWLMLCNIKQEANSGGGFSSLLHKSKTTIEIG